MVWVSNRRRRALLEDFTIAVAGNKEISPYMVTSVQHPPPFAAENAHAALEVLRQSAIVGDLRSSRRAFDLAARLTKEALSVYRFSDQQIHEIKESVGQDRTSEHIIFGGIVANNMISNVRMLEAFMVNHGHFHQLFRHGVLFECYRIFDWFGPKSN